MKLFKIINSFYLIHKNEIRYSSKVWLTTVFVLPIILFILKLISTTNIINEEQFLFFGLMAIVGLTFSFPYFILFIFIVGFVSKNRTLIFCQK